MSNKPSMTFRQEGGKIVSPANDVLTNEQIIEMLNHYFIIIHEKEVLLKIVEMINLLVGADKCN